MLDLDALGVDLDALGLQIAGSGRSGSADCWTCKLWECRLLDLHALGVQIAGSGCFLESRLLDLDALEVLHGKSQASRDGNELRPC